MNEQVWLYRRLIQHWLCYMCHWDVDEAIALLAATKFDVATSNRLGRVLLMEWWFERGHGEQ